MEAGGSGRERRTRRIAVLALVLCGGLFTGASSLGALDRTGVRASRGAVASCETGGVKARFKTDWDVTDRRYEIRAVTVSGISDACDGQAIKVALTGSGGGELGKASLTIPPSTATSFELSLPNPPSAESVDDIHIVIGR